MCADGGEPARLERAAAGGVGGMGGNGIRPEPFCGRQRPRAPGNIPGAPGREILRVADRIPEMPAGGSALGVIIGAGLVVFIVLLVTDILGFTHVFPFVTHRR